MIKHYKTCINTIGEKIIFIDDRGKTTIGLVRA
jgi:hypothetical protein